MKKKHAEHTKNAEVQLSQNQCVAICDANAFHEGKKIPANSPVFKKNTQKALKKREIFSKVHSADEPPMLTKNYGELFVDIALAHFFRKTEKKRIKRKAARR